MKNLILTFVFALVSLVSFTQNMYVILGSSNDITINVVNGNTLSLSDEFDNAINVKKYDEGFALIDSTLATNVISYTTDALSDTILYLKVFYVSSAFTPKQITVIFADNFASTSENTLTREELKVYPSPATSETKISFFADKSDMVVNIFSLNGQLIYQDDASREVGMINVLELNVSEWASGVYLVNNGKETFKFVVL